MHEIIPDSPVARFYYQGQSHSHPVRRTILLISETPQLLIGYEVRDGNNVRPLKKAPIKSFRKDRIAKFGDYCRLRKKQKSNKTTLKRENIMTFLCEGP